MKAQIENFLQKIDISMKEKTQKDIYMTYIMIFAVIFAFSYLLFWETSFNDFETKRKQVVSTQKKITNDENYLKRNPKAKIIKIENETKKTHKNMLVYKENNKYIKNKIEDISFLMYDKQAWGEYLHSISKNAKINKIKILDFTNHYSKKDTSFGHILDINIKATGSYTNTLNFINSLEQNELVVDLHTFSIEAKDKLLSDLYISVWGITY
jgi:Tfp pilus assembly protein PilO